MLNHAATLALSLSLVSLAASPALAQMRKTEPAPAVAKTQPTLSASEMTKPKVEFTLMGGYRFMHGGTMNVGWAGTGTAWTKTDNSAPTANPLTTYSSSEPTSSTENYTNTLRHGFSLSGSATYWLDPSFGLGLDYTFAHTGAKLENLHSLGYTAKLPSVDVKDNDPADGTKTETKVAVNPTLNFNGANLAVSVSNQFVQQPGATGDNDPRYGYTTTRITNFPDLANFNASTMFQVANPAGGLLNIPANTFVNTEKAIPTAAGDTSPTVSYKAEGKVGLSQADSTTMHFAEAQTKTVIGSNARGELHLLAGLTIPMITNRTVTTVAITGANGTGAAKQTVTYVDRADATKNATQVITVDAKQEADTSTTSTMVGPMIGLGGTFKVNDGFRLYGKFGYTPTMLGNAAASTTTTAKATLITENTPATGTPSKDTVVRNSSDTNGVRHFQAGGISATSFMLGARFNLTDSLGLNVEGVNQTVANLGYTGLNAGVSLAF